MMTELSDQILEILPNRESRVGWDQKCELHHQVPISVRPMGCTQCDADVRECLSVNLKWFQELDFLLVQIERLANQADEAPPQKAQGGPIPKSKVVMGGPEGKEIFIPGQLEVRNDQQNIYIGVIQILLNIVELIIILRILEAL